MQKEWKQLVIQRSSIRLFQDCSQVLKCVHLVPLVSFDIKDVSSSFSSSTSPFQTRLLTMPLSLRLQHHSMKERLQSRVQAVQNRKQVVQYLCNQKSIQEVSSLTGVSQPTVKRLSRSIRSKDYAVLSAMTSAGQSQGRRSVITDEEARVIKDRLILAAIRGF